MRLYKREVKTWRRLIKDFLPVDEQGLRLSTGFTSKAKDKLYDRFDVSVEFGDMDGVDKLLKWVEEAFGEEEVVNLQQRVDDFYGAPGKPLKLLRHSGETMRDYVDRFDRCYERLKEVGEECTQKTLCNRLLRLSGLGMKEQLRLVQETGNDADYSKLKTK